MQNYLPEEIVKKVIEETNKVGGMYILSNVLEPDKKGVGLDIYVSDGLSTKNLVLFTHIIMSGLIHQLRNRKLDWDSIQKMKEVGLINFNSTLSEELFKFRPE